MQSNTSLIINLLFSQQLLLYLMQEVLAGLNFISHVAVFLFSVVKVMKLPLVAVWQTTPM